MKIEKKEYPSKKGTITVFRLTNAGGAWVELSTLGAGIVGVGVPDSNGKIENVALGYADPADYLYDGPCMGKCPGRYANRIAGGDLKIDDIRYQLTVNNGPNALHGGPEGFQNQIWAARELPDGIEFSYHSADGEENYPGNMEVKAIYAWSDDNALTLRFEAVCDHESVINLTNHSYWNLDGAESGCALGHTLVMKASRWLPTDDTLIPLGELDPVEGTPMDFRTPKTLERDIKCDFSALNYGKGYDNCWAIDEWEPGVITEAAAVLTAPKSGRMLIIDTDQPGMQVYTGNWLDGSPKGRDGHDFADYDGVAIEMQGFPDAPHQPSFPSQSIYPGETYRRTIRFRFA